MKIDEIYREVLVTPAMARAGDLVLLEYDPLYDSSELLLKDLFLAMLEASVEDKVDHTLLLNPLSRHHI